MIVILNAQHEGSLGYTLIEMMLVILFLAIVIAPLTGLLTTSLTAGRISAFHTQAQNLAVELMEEISQKKFEDPDGTAFGNEEGTSCCSRAAFDDVDDYDVYQTWGALNPPRDVNGVAISGMGAFSRSAAVVNIADLGLSPSNVRTDYSPQTDGSTDFKLVTVTVTWDNGKAKAVIQRVFAKY